MERRGPERQASPGRYQPGIGLRPGGERPDLEPLVEILYVAMYESIAAHSRRGVNVVVDATHHDRYSRPLMLLGRCARVLAGLPVLVVGVHCPLDVIMQRRWATWGQGYEPDGSVPDAVLRWQEAVHVPGTYDHLEVDRPAMSPEAAARVIAQQLAKNANGGAAASLLAAVAST